MVVAGDETLMELEVGANNKKEKQQKTQPLGSEQGSQEQRNVCVLKPHTKKAGFDLKQAP